MNISGYSSEFTERSKAVTGCFAMFTLFLGITFLPNFYAGSKALLVEGYLYPLLFGLEFMIITPLYYIYFRNREGHGKGQFRSGIFLTLFLCAFRAVYYPLYYSCKTGRKLVCLPDGT